MREMDKLATMLKENNIPFEEKKWGNGFIQHVVFFPSFRNCQIEASSNYFNDKPYPAGAPAIRVWTLGAEDSSDLITAEVAFEYFKAAGLNAHKYTVHVSMRFTKNFKVVAHTEEEAAAIVEDFMTQSESDNMEDEDWTFANENKDIWEVK